MAQPQEQKTHQQPHNLPFLLDTLYCEESHWEEEVREEGFLEEEEEESYYGDGSKPNAPPLLEPDLLCEDEELVSLFSKEEKNDLHSNPESNPLAAGARARPFLFSCDVQGEKPWMTQLAAVACLSLAAKVEETQVPLLLDLQVEETMYVFEAKTIQRMEIMVLSTLRWKMNPVTPLSFLDYITRRLGLKNHLCWEFLKRCERVLLSVLSDCRFGCYLPSVIATAIMLHVIDSVEPCIRAQYQSQLLGILGIDKDKVEDCSQLILDIASSARCHHHNKRKFSSTPGSPNGVMDGWFSCDSSNDSWAVASSVSSSPSSSEHLSKKSRGQEQHLQTLNQATADAPTVIPR
ncbi:Cyclin-D3-1 [Vitis vinifera]|uniref:Cyclin-D3-1 n=1 Tax=Vitis vinifera TaxID=29760 RepID=A0A438ITM9_VITVI|nr:Cyclin-D3-1 [Vitis vinifera]